MQKQSNTLETRSNKVLAEPTGDYERFLYSVSHDLQEPLRMVSSFLKLFEAKAGDTVSDEAKEYLNYCLENADRIKRMMAALVDLSRVNRSQEEIVPVDLNGVLNDLFSMYSNEIRLNEGVVEYDELPAVMMAPGQAVQLFKALVQNCFDYRAERPLRIEVRTLVKGDFCEITVKDNGKGINPLYLDKLFEMFKRFGHGNDHTGAGLTLAREIVKRYGGTISLDSKEGEWTAVKFTLPKAVI